MATKALIIDVNTNGVLNGNQGSWQDATNQMGRVTPNIKTPEVQDADDESGQLAAIVSGMPTPFARPTLFGNALVAAGNNQKETTGLQTFYDSLIREWRGLIACIALNTSSGKLKAETIELAYSDGLSLDKTENIYEPKGAFGNMLLNKRKMWCDQKAPNIDLAKPQITILKYDGQVVAGTSPETLVFTAPYYEIKDDEPYINPQTHKFDDPLKVGSLQSSGLLDLWAYVSYLSDHIKDLSAYYKPLGNIAPDYTNIQKELDRWKREIDTKIKDNHLDQDKALATPQPVSIFTQKPFRSFFNYSDRLYSVNGIVFAQEQPQSIEFSPDELLLDDSVEVVRLRLPSSDVANFPLSVLRATKKEGTGQVFFALPLTELGVIVFEKNMDALLKVGNKNSENSSSLDAVFEENGRGGKLTVTLTLKTGNGRSKIITRNYSVSSNIQQQKDLIIWPNFASRQWNKYYLYTEMTPNASNCPFVAVPFCGNTGSHGVGLILKQEDNAEESHIALLDGEAKEQKINSKDNDNNIVARLDVVTDYRTVDQPYKYEIFETNRPFRGIELRRFGKSCGYFLIRYSQDRTNPHLPYDYAAQQVQPTEVSLGVDFGSTNTSVAYYDVNDGANGFHFHNMRISLLQGLQGLPEEIDRRLPTMENTLFFFQRNNIGSNTVKSMLTQHDPKRLPEGRSLAREAVTGGFPCFSRDLPISTVNDGLLTLQFPSGVKADIVNDMKWRGDDSDRDHKKAFLSSLMLQVYAEMFNMRKIPTRLTWSYPSSMGASLLQQYSDIWNALKDLSPVVRQDGTPWPLDISKTPAFNVDVSSNNPFGTVDGGDSFGAAGGNNPFGVEEADPFGATGSDPFGNTADTSDPFGNSGGADPFASQQTSSSMPDGFEGFGVAKPTKKIKDLEPDNGPIEFNITPLLQNTSLTEACSVAKFITRNSDSRVLTLCFDIGGSTTDISAICSMKDQSGAEHPTLIKQNSVRFAAQRVSRATSVLYAQFKKVLLDTCEQFHIEMTGLNRGGDKYNSDTAPYFYEQLVDMLSPQGQVAFYHKISADCQPLFCVNLYVTGLIMFYAGQITEKLIKELRRATDGPGENWKCYVEVKLVGKGSRIFDWFSLTNYNGAQAYCRAQFTAGMGGQNNIGQYLLGWPAFRLNKEVNEDVKYEVAKGLAIPQTDLYVPQGDTAIEILGEDGFSIKTASTGKVTQISFDNSLTADMMEQLGTNFLAPRGGNNCPRFVRFAGIYYTYAQKLFGLKMTIDDFKKGFGEMDINSYIKEQPEYRAAQNRAFKKEGKFDYVNPIIILEGMKFYEDCLLKGITKQKD